TAGGGDEYVLRAVKGENLDKEDAANQKHLAQSDLNWMSQAAISRWLEAGISIEEAQRLGSVKLELANLPGDQLAVVTPSTIQIDEDAAGYGWFYDLNPQDDSQFALPIFDRERQGELGSPAFCPSDVFAVNRH